MMRREGVLPVATTNIGTATETGAYEGTIASQHGQLLLGIMTTDACPSLSYLIRQLFAKLHHRNSLRDTSYPIQSMYHTK